MLLSLQVKNLALIDEMEVIFGDGLNILSGETGAGKSIIIGSINMALGEKVSKEMVREQGKDAFVELIFTVSHKEQEEKLRQMDILLEDGQIILSRKIVNGRSIAKINGESVPASKLRQVASLLIDIHGQQEHQSLSNKHKHLEILDDYGKKELEGSLKAVSKAYKEYQALREEWKGFSMDEEQRLREVSFLEYEIHEIEEANFQENEDVELETQFKKMLHGKKILEGAGQAYEATSNGEDSASSLVEQALRAMNNVSEYDESIKELRDQLGEIESLLNDFNRSISDYLVSADFEEASFYQIEQRLDTLNHIKSKYGDSYEKVMESLKERQEKYEQLHDYEAHKKQKEEALQKAEKTLEAECEKLSKKRQKAAKKMSAQIRASLGDLNFLDVQFEMKFNRSSHYTAEGYDDVEIQISTNPGEPMKPLGKVASGGELSRIMLGIKTVLAENDKIDTLIFDEIDTGISGRTAQMVSEKMAEIARNHQLICITHLPQIAAMADTHFLIEKSVKGKETKSAIFRLAKEDEVKELARMLGGVSITDTVLDSAREMKELAESRKEIKFS